MSGVIITSSEYRTALVACRCLGKHGVKVACGGEKEAKFAFFPPAFYSKYCSKRFVYPSYRDDTDGFVEAIIDFANKNKEYEVLMPIDAETSVISKYKEMIEVKAPHLRVPVHEYKYIDIANNKRKMMELANDLGIPIPKTHTPSSLKEVEVIAAEIEYPAVIKLPSAKGSKGFVITYSKDELLQKYGNTFSKYCFPTYSEAPLVQEYIPGTGYGVSCLFNRGELRAKFTHRRIRELPITGGPSVVRISASHPEMEEYAIKLLKSLNWHGVVMVEFRLDERDNQPKLMEVNPRFWGSLHQAISAGVEFPYLLYQMVLNGDVDPVTNYKIGVKARFMWGDMQAFPEHLLASNSKVKFLKDFFNFKNETYDDLSFEDPLPAVVQVLNPVVRLLRTGHIGWE